MGCGQHCTGIFLVQCWPRQIKTALYRSFSCENMSVCSGPTLYKLFSRAMLSHKYLDNIDWTIFLCNVVPARSIQHCIGYFPHKSCLLAMGQHFTGDFFVQCWPRQIQTTLHKKKKPFLMLSFDAPSYFKKNISNINITLYSC